MKKICFSLFILVSSLILIFTGKVSASSTSQEVVNYEGITNIVEGKVLDAGYYAFLHGYQDINDFKQQYSISHEYGMIDTEEYMIRDNLDSTYNFLPFTIQKDILEYFLGLSDESESSSRDKGWAFYELDDRYRLEDIAGSVDEIYDIYKLEIKATEIHNDGNLILNYDDSITLERIKARYTANDNYDGDITHKLQFETNYPNNYDEVKVNVDYYITASVTDTSGNKTNVTSTIRVVDTTKPKFDAKMTNFIYEYGDEISFAKIFESISCGDNYDKSIASSNFKIRDNKEIDTALLHKEQNFTIYVADSSGNEATLDITVTILDNEAPVITINDIISASSNNPLSEETLILMLKNSDLIPSEYQDINIISDYFGNETKAGEYIATCVITDNDNNVQSYRFSINVDDNQVVNDTDVTIYIIFGILGGAALVGGILFVVIRRKKCNFSLRK